MPRRLQATRIGEMWPPQSVNRDRTPWRCRTSPISSPPFMPAGMVSRRGRGVKPAGARAVLAFLLPDKGRRIMRVAGASVVVLCLAAPLALAQTEEALRTALLGRTVLLKIDMPASHKGIDLRFDKEEPFNVSEHSSRVREHDASIRSGDRVPITHVKVKDDLIEVQ